VCVQTDPSLSRGYTTFFILLPFEQFYSRWRDASTLNIATPERFGFQPPYEHLALFFLQPFCSIETSSFPFPLNPYHNSRKFDPPMVPNCTIIISFPPPFPFTILTYSRYGRWVRVIAPKPFSVLTPTVVPYAAIVTFLTYCQYILGCLGTSIFPRASRF